MADPREIMTKRVRQIMTTLMILDDDRIRAKQIEAFLGCNSFHSVLQSAQGTAKTLRRDPGRIRNPWDYTEKGYYKNLSRLSYLYYLTHWTENGLRCQIDLHYCSVSSHTTDWYKYPEDYLLARKPEEREENISQFLKGSFSGRLDILRNISNSDGFFEKVSLYWIKQMITRAIRVNSKVVFAVESGQRPAETHVTDLLHDFTMARNAVAHNHRINDIAFKRYQPRLIQLLHHLNFDLAAAVTAVERERSAIVRQQQYIPPAH
jgi:hypothetical protein